MRNLQTLNPRLTVAGARDGYFKPEETSRVVEDIRAAKPDLIWLGLGTPKQQEFIAAHKNEIGHGIWLAVGFAFDVNAGTKRDAPPWMQKLGLTWLYRISQEPRRLFPRYLKFNTLFIYYSLLEQIFGIGGLDVGTPQKGKQTVAFLGCRGVPARYSGFETLVEQLGARLAERGHAVTVYNRSHFYPERPASYRGMKIAYLPSLQTKSFETITHTLLAVIHAAVRKFDVVYLCGVGNAALAGILKLSGSRVIVNVDGDDFRRLKWHPFARWWLKQSEEWATKLSNVVIADNRTVVDRYERDYGFKTTYLSYGAPERPAQASKEALRKLGLKAGEYVLYAGRLTPENRPDLLIRAYEKVKGDLQVARNIKSKCDIDKLFLLLADFCTNNRLRQRLGLYLRRRTFINSSVYKSLLHSLPGPLPGKSLADFRPDLIKEWHVVKNGSLTPSKMTLNSGRVVWWKCEIGHE